VLTVCPVLADVYVIAVCHGNIWRNQRNEALMVEDSMSDPSINSEIVTMGKQPGFPSGISETSIWSFKGRIGPEIFWNRNFYLGLFIFLFKLLKIPPLMIIMPIFTRSYLLFALIVVTRLCLLMVAILMIWLWLATQMKRWHDLNRSGWMILLYLAIIPGILSLRIFRDLHFGQLFDRLGLYLCVVAIIAMPIALYYILVCIGFLQGTSGPNRFGIDPRCVQNYITTDISETSIWSPKGRIGLFSFWIRMFLLMVLSFIVFHTIQVCGPDGYELYGEGIFIILFIVSCITAVWFALILQVKRWHDLDYSGLMIISVLAIITIPVIFVYMCVLSGTKGPNRFGANETELKRQEA
jgi:uncharacterized membrane protein YhaH (DUF805 family)